MIALIFLGRHQDGRWWQTRHQDPFPSMISGYAEPIDGDSLRVDGNEIRLKGIDAPEWRQVCSRDGARWNCGEAAGFELVRAIGNDRVTCTISGRDVYGRMLGRCSAAGRDLNAGLVLSGFAVAFGDYLREQAMARAERRGLWSGEFELPSNWRAEHSAGN